jgi:hypothetical protein
MKAFLFYALFIIHDSAFSISLKDLPMKRHHDNGVATSKAWRSAMFEDRIARAEHLLLPSGATILAVKPEPLDWILSGRIPQQLLGVALEKSAGAPQERDAALTRDEILDLAGFARQLVRASVVKPSIGDGPDEIAMDDIPVRDRAFIFEWACRALKGSTKNETRNSKLENGPSAIANHKSPMEGLSSEKLERFRQE